MACLSSLVAHLRPTLPFPHVHAHLLCILYEHRYDGYVYIANLATPLYIETEVTCYLTTHETTTHNKRGHKLSLQPKELGRWVKESFTACQLSPHTSYRCQCYTGQCLHMRLYTRDIFIPFTRLRCTRYCLR